MLRDPRTEGTTERQSALGSPIQKQKAAQTWHFLIFNLATEGNPCRFIPPLNHKGILLTTPCESGKGDR